MIALVDYGAGNLTSVRKALAAIGADVMTSRTPEDLDRVSGIIVPGVGHFDATRAIDQAWRDGIRAALDRGVALLGICLGMQWLFEGSDEAPDLPGLGVFVGTCGFPTGPACPTSPVPTRPTSPTRPTRLKVPHVGWNSLELPRVSTLMQGVAPHAQVYFTHSYVAPVVADTAAITCYGIPFSSAVERGRVAGVQFHPEKSGGVGLRILENWMHCV